MTVKKSLLEMTSNARHHHSERNERSEWSRRIFSVIPTNFQKRFLDYARNDNAEARTAFAVRAVYMFSSDNIFFTSSVVAALKRLTLS